MQQAPRDLLNLEGAVRLLRAHGLGLSWFGTSRILQLLTFMALKTSGRSRSTKLSSFRLNR